jgi:hypothetical protein
VVPLVRESGGSLVVRNKDAHFSPANYPVVWSFGVFYFQGFREYLAVLAPVQPELAAAIDDLSAAIAVPTATTPADPEVVEQSLRMGRGAYSSVVRMIANSGWRPRDQHCVLDTSLVLLEMIAGEFDYATRNGRVEEAARAERALVRPRHDPSDVEGMTATRLRDIADDKEVVPAVAARVRAEIQGLGSEMRRVLAFNQWTDRFPDFRRGDFSLLDLDRRFGAFGAIERMDLIIKDPRSVDAVRREMAEAAGLFPDASDDRELDGGIERLLACWVDNTRLFVELLLDYVQEEEAVEAVLQRLSTALGGIADREPVEALSVLGAVEDLMRRLAASFADGTGSVGKEDLRRLRYGTDLVAAVVQIRAGQSNTPGDLPGRLNLT